MEERVVPDSTTPNGRAPSWVHRAGYDKFNMGTIVNITLGRIIENCFVQTSASKLKKSFDFPTKSVCSVWIDVSSYQQLKKLILPEIRYLLYSLIKSGRRGLMRLHTACTSLWMCPYLIGWSANEMTTTTKTMMRMMEAMVTAQGASCGLHWAVKWAFARGKAAENLSDILYYIFTF